MKSYSARVYSFMYAAIFLLSLITDLYQQLVLIFFFMLLFSLLGKLGTGIVLREIIATYTVFVCLIMPLAGYNFFTRENKLAVMFSKYMPIPLNAYFSFALPAVSAFVFALCLPFNSKGVSDEGKALSHSMERIRGIFKTPSNSGLYLMIIGIFSILVTPYFPESLQFFLTLFYWSAFTGVLYIYFSPSLKYRKTALGLFLLFIFMQALQQGMFTIVAYMGMTIFSFIFLGKHSSMFKKVLIFTFCVFALMLIQSVKNNYRDYTWRGKYGVVENKAVLFSKLISEKLANPRELFDANAFFPIYMRTNQGFNVAMVMRRFPALKEFDEGKNLLTNAASALIPRLFWPNKPMAGGKFNMAYYTGFTIRGWSTNVGPLGEAYGSFGVKGGIVYMFFLGLFIRWAYRKVFLIAKNCRSSYSGYPYFSSR